MTRKMWTIGAIVALPVLALMLATDWVAAQEPVFTGVAPAPPTKDIVYMGVPSVESGATLRHGGAGILVWQVVGDRYEFIKRISLGDYPSWQGPTRVIGIAAHAGTGRLYASEGRRTVALDLLTDKVIWEAPYGGRIALTPDGKTIYAPGSGDPKGWAVLDASTGKLVTMLLTPKTRAGHNTIVSPDGSRVFMSTTSDGNFSIGDTATNKTIQTIEFSHQTRVFTINSKADRVYMTMVDLLGFEIGDPITGKKLHRVEVPGFGWSRARILGHGTPSHGVALTPDEKEVWVVDGVNGLVHVMDNTVMPPTYKTSIKVRDTMVGWLTFSIDGTRIYAGTGDVIDVATRKVIGALNDEYGRWAQSEAMVDVRFDRVNRKVLAAGNSFAIGQATTASRSSAAR